MLHGLRRSDQRRVRATVWVRARPQSSRSADHRLRRQGTDEECQVGPDARRRPRAARGVCLVAVAYANHPRRGCADPAGGLRRVYRTIHRPQLSNRKEAGKALQAATSNVALAPDTIMCNLSALPHSFLPLPSLSLPVLLPVLQGLLTMVGLVLIQTYSVLHLLVLAVQQQMSWGALILNRHQEELVSLQCLHLWVLVHQHIH